MTSLINSNQINVNYPVAGQDNDTQGFRNNFQNIQTSFNIAASEVTALQANASLSLLIQSTVPATITSYGRAGNVAFDSGNLWVATSPNSWLRFPTAGLSNNWYSDANVATYLANNPVSVSYSNANVASYLVSSTGNIQAGNINAITFSNAKTIVASNFFYANGISAFNGVTYNYSNANVASYLTTYSGNITSANVSTGNLYASNFYYANGVNLVSSLSNQFYTNSNVSSYLTVYSGNITAGNVLSNNFLFANGVSILTNINANTANTATKAVYVTGLTASNVTTALGSNPVPVATTATYVTGLTSANVTTALGANPVQVATTSTYVTGLTSANVTTALGYTPYNSSNPSNYATQSYVTSQGYATQSYVTSQGYITSVPNSSTQVSSLGVGTSASGTTGEIRATNNITAYYSSDATLKENIRPIPDALATVVAIGGMLFDWRDSYIKDHGGEDGYFIQKSDFGVIAQDVLHNFPLATRKRPDGTLAVDYEKLSALSFAALVEVSNRLDKLEGK
jgi:Chaperone of endosialidase